MKIALLIPSLKPTGPVRVAIDLAALYRECDHQVVVLYFDESPNVVEDIPTQRISFGKNKDLSAYDVVHSHGLRPDYWVKRFRKHWPHVRTVTTLHNYVFPELKFQYNRFIAIVFSPLWMHIVKRFDVQVVFSEDMARYYRDRWKLTHVRVIPNTRQPDLAEPRPEIVETIEQFRGTAPMVVSLSHVTERKGLSQVLKALQMQPDWRFLHFGEGRNWQQLKAQARQLGVASRCLFLGSHSDARSYLHLADALVMPSRSEGFPLALLEAVQQHIPVVCSNIPAFTALFDPHEIAFFHLDDTEDFVRAIGQVLTEGSTFADNALARFNEAYSPSVVAGKYLDIYQDRSHAPTA